MKTPMTFLAAFLLGSLGWCASAATIPVDLGTPSDSSAQVDNATKSALTKAAKSSNKKKKAANSTSDKSKNDATSASDKSKKEATSTSNKKKKAAASTPRKIKNADTPTSDKAKKADTSTPLKTKKVTASTPDKAKKGAASTSQTKKEVATSAKKVAASTPDKRKEEKELSATPSSSVKTPSTAKKPSTAKTPSTVKTAKTPTVVKIKDQSTKDLWAKSLHIDSKNAKEMLAKCSATYERKNAGTNHTAALEACMNDKNFQRNLRVQMNTTLYERLRLANNQQLVGFFHACQGRHRDKKTPSDQLAACLEESQTTTALLALDVTLGPDVTPLAGDDDQINVEDLQTEGGLEPVVQTGHCNCPQVRESTAPAPITTQPVTTQPATTAVIDTRPTSYGHHDADDDDDRRGTVGRRSTATNIPGILNDIFGNGSNSGMNPMLNPMSNPYYSQMAAQQMMYQQAMMQNYLAAQFAARSQMSPLMGRPQIPNYGLGFGRTLPGAYPAPGGAASAWPGQPGAFAGSPIYNGAPRYAGAPGMVGAPYGAPVGMPGGIPGAMPGAYPGAIPVGYRPGAPVAAPYGGVPGAYGSLPGSYGMPGAVVGGPVGGGIIGGGVIGAGMMGGAVGGIPGRAPAILPAVGGGASYGGSFPYSNALGTYQYPQLPPAYPAPNPYYI